MVYSYIISYSKGTGFAFDGIQLDRYVTQLLVTGIPAEEIEIKVNTANTPRK